MCSWSTGISGGVRGREPVAITIVLARARVRALPSTRRTSTSWAERKRARPCQSVDAVALELVGRCSARGAPHDAVEAAHQARDLDVGPDAWSTTPAGCAVRRPRQVDRASRAASCSGSCRGARTRRRRRPRARSAAPPARLGGLDRRLLAGRPAADHDHVEARGGIRDVARRLHAKRLGELPDGLRAGPSSASSSSG